MVLSREEESVLEGLRERLRKRGDEVEACNEEEERVSSSRPSTDCTMVKTQSGSERSNSDTAILCPQGKD